MISFIQLDSHTDSSRFFLQQVFMYTDFSFKLYMELCEIWNPNWLVPWPRCSMYEIVTYILHLPYIYLYLPIFAYFFVYIYHKYSIHRASGWWKNLFPTKQRQRRRQRRRKRCPCWSWRCVKAPSWRRTPGSWRLGIMDSWHQHERSQKKNLENQTGLGWEWWNTSDFCFHS